jgi:hypothetical protein
MVHLLGWDHNLQDYELIEHDEDIRKIEYSIKDKFYKLTTAIISKNRIRFVGEECKRGAKTIARIVAGELACPYDEIDMPLEERANHGIARDYQLSGAPEVDRVYKLREQYMFDKITSKSGFDGEKLIVCGAEHLKGLAARFTSHGQIVDVRDLTKEDWLKKIYQVKFEKL